MHKTPLGYALVGARGERCLGDSAGRSVLQTSTLLSPVNFKHKFDTKCKLASFDTFERRRDDGQPGLSVEDRKFLDIMTGDVMITGSGNVQLPLPLKTEDLPDNRAAVLMRTKVT